MVESKERPPQTSRPAATTARSCILGRRGQISGVLVDGPLAFDNAISTAAAKEKGIASDVAGDADIILVPDLVSGNMLVKNPEYLAGATLAGAVVPRGAGHPDFVCRSSARPGRLDRIGGAAPQAQRVEISHALF